MVQVPQVPTWTMEEDDVGDALSMDFDAIEQEEDARLGWFTAGETEQGESAQASGQKHTSQEISQAQTEAGSIAIHESSDVASFADVVKLDTGANSGAIARLSDHEDVQNHPLRKQLQKSSLF